MSTRAQGKRRSAAASKGGERHVPLEELGLFPYQLAWLREESRFKIGLWARQTGKDYTCSLEAVLDCLEREKSHWLMIGASERQACECLAKAEDWVMRLKELDRFQGPSRGKLDCRVGRREIRFSNGARITALPARPSTIRGYSANLVLTEFAFHDEPERFWHAVFPMLSNPSRGGEKKLRIITTPNGQGTFFHRLCGDRLFKTQVVTIHRAVADGLPVEVQTLRAGLADDEAWAQEYECQFTDASSVLLPYELIESCSAREATQTSTADQLAQCTGEIFVGIDVGRLRDLTVCWTLERVEEKLWTREVLVLKRAGTPEQLAELRPRVRLAHRVCIDATGLGTGLADWLGGEFGHRVERCLFTSNFKAELFPRLRCAFERGVIIIPPGREIREDLHGIRRVVSHNGQVSYRASHSADGHSDRCTALALALRAAERSGRIRPASILNGHYARTRGTLV